MTQEEKKLLIKDLCARVPYGMFVHHKNVNQDYNLIAVFDDGRIGVTTLKENIGLTPTSINECKPYLRPISSMTEDEKESFHKLKVYKHNDCKDWYNSHHLDDRGLIEKGLALEAPEGMYKTE